jgi:hypothetical protein
MKELWEITSLGIKSVQLELKGMDIEDLHRIKTAISTMNILVIDELAKRIIEGEN